MTCHDVADANGSSGMALVDGKPDVRRREKRRNLWGGEVVAQPGLSSAWPGERKEFLKGKQSNLSLDLSDPEEGAERELNADCRIRDGLACPKIQVRGHQC